MDFTLEQMTKVLDLVARVDARDALFWSIKDNGQVQFFVDCSDFFMWGTSDLEPLRPEDLPMFVQCYEDYNKAWESSEDTNSASNVRWHIVTFLDLYAARNRGFRPMKEYYNKWLNEDQVLVDLFDACGPAMHDPWSKP